MFHSSQIQMSGDKHWGYFIFQKTGTYDFISVNNIQMSLLLNLNISMKKVRGTFISSLISTFIGLQEMVFYEMDTTD